MLDTNEIGGFIADCKNPGYLVNLAHNIIDKLNVMGERSHLSALLDRLHMHGIVTVVAKAESKLVDLVTREAPKLAAIAQEVDNVEAAAALEPAPAAPTAVAPALKPSAPAAQPSLFPAAPAPLIKEELPAPAKK